jgi:ABC-type nitrate/sulfonate/bicarbonate transport system substrate-binding protein
MGGIERMASLTRRGLIPVGLAALLLVGCGAPPAQPSAAPASAPAAAAPAQAAAPPPAQSSSGPASAPAAGPQTLTKVVQALPVESFGFLPMYVGREKGFFRDEGLDLQTPLMGSSAALAGLLNGEVDFAVAGSGVRAAMQGAPVKAIMYTYNSVLFEFVVVPEIRTLEDLKGKNVGTSSRGGSEEVTANVMLRQVGLDPATDVTYVVVPAGSQLPTLLAEAIQGMMINPDLSALAAGNGLRVLKNVEEVGRAMPAPFSGFVSAQEALQKNPEMVKAWLRANVRSIRFVRENPEESAAIIARVLGMDPAVAAEALPRVAQTINPDDFGGFTAEGFQLEVDTSLRALGGQAQVTKIDDLADLTLLRQAQRELGVPCKTGYQCR